MLHNNIGNRIRDISLQKIKKLPCDTLVYCAHEYTLKNCEFA